MPGMGPLIGALMGPPRPIMPMFIPGPLHRSDSSPQPSVGSQPLRDHWQTGGSLALMRGMALPIRCYF